MEIQKPTSGKVFILGNQRSGTNALLAYIWSNHLEAKPFAMAEPLGSNINPVRSVRDRNKEARLDDMKHIPMDNFFKDRYFNWNEQLTNYPDADFAVKFLFRQWAISPALKHRLAKSGSKILANEAELYARWSTEYPHIKARLLYDPDIYRVKIVRKDIVAVVTSTWIGLHKLRQRNPLSKSLPWHGRVGDEEEAISIPVPDINMKLRNGLNSNTLQLAFLALQNEELIEYDGMHFDATYYYEDIVHNFKNTRPRHRKNSDYPNNGNICKMTETAPSVKPSNYQEIYDAINELYIRWKFYRKKEQDEELLNANKYATRRDKG